MCADDKGYLTTDLVIVCCTCKKPIENGAIYCKDCHEEFKPENEKEVLDYARMLESERERRGV